MWNLDNIFKLKFNLMTERDKILQVLFVNIGLHLV